MSSDFLVRTATLRRVIEQSTITPQFREAFIAWLTDHGAFVDNTIPSIKLGMLIGEMTTNGGFLIDDNMNTVFDDIRNLDKLPFVTLFHPAESVSDLHRRDAKRMKLGHSVMKTAPIAATDVGKIFVVSIDGQTGRIMPRDEFLALPIESYDCWEEIGEFDINQ